MTIQNRLTEAEAAELKLDSYLMHIHRTKCACGAHEHYHTLFEVWVHPSKTKTTGFRDLRPMIRDNMRDLPISYINMPFKLTTICSNCVKHHKSSGGFAAAEAANPVAWAETLRRKYTPEQKEVKIAKQSTPGKYIPTLDEL